MNVKFPLIWLIIFISFTAVNAQRTKWKRRIPENKLKLHLFHSTQSINLPTAETMQHGDFQFEISHRFIPTIKSGSKELWGFDGPSNIRLGLGYAITDDLVVILGRSNQDNNLDLALKQSLFQIDSKIIPITSAIVVGSAWNSDVPNINSNDIESFQFFGQFIVNTLIQKRLGIGLVPSYLYNSHLQCAETQYSFTFGTYLQYYFSDMYSAIVEWNPTVTGWRQDYNPVSFGFEIETGGHFFKIILTNSSDLNASQFLSGADKSFDSGEWRFGFNITRLL